MTQHHSSTENTEGTANMATENMYNSTPLDDLKDLVYEAKKSNELLASELEVHNIYLDDSEALEAVDGLVGTAISALAKHVPGMRPTSYGMAHYETEESRLSANTYDDGTPVVEHINFPDANGIGFTYRHRHDGPRDQFMAWARETATKHQEGVHNRYVTVGGMGVEYIGTEEEQFHAHLGEDARLALSRDQVQELRNGLTRILATQARDGDSSIPETGEEWADAKVFGDGFVYLAPFYGGEVNKPGVVVESSNSKGQSEVLMSPAEARVLAAQILDRADDAEHRQAKQDTADRLEARIRDGVKNAFRDDQDRVPEILAAVTDGTATNEQLSATVELPGGIVKTWEHVTPDELKALRRAHSF